MRNAYGHYKWTANIDLHDEEKKQISSKLAVAEKVVRYLRDYEDQTVHSAQGKRLRKMFRREKTKK